MSDGARRGVITHAVTGEPYQITTLGPTRDAVVRAVAYYYKRGGKGVATASVASYAKRAGISEKTARRCLRDLEAEGRIIAPCGISKGGRPEKRSKARPQTTSYKFPRAKQPGKVDAPTNENNPVKFSDETLLQREGGPSGPPPPTVPDGPSSANDLDLAEDIRASAHRLFEVTRKARNEKRITGLQSASIQRWCTAVQEMKPTSDTSILAKLATEYEAHDRLVRPDEYADDEPEDDGFFPPEGGNDQELMETYR